MDNTINRLGLLSTAALLLLSPASAGAAPPDLCDELVVNAAGEVYRDSTGASISRWCEPRTDPPAWDAPVCCVVTDEANCVPTNSRGRCDVGMAFWCDYGERVDDGVACYQPGPSACDVGGCMDIENPNGMEVFHAAIWLCCTEHSADDIECSHAGMGDSPNMSCGGFLAICNWGVTNQDGTVECYG